MKIRSDFVTNSSSSSFIFKEDSMKELREQVLKEVMKGLKEDYLVRGSSYCKDFTEYASYDLESIEHTLDHLCEDVKPWCEHFTVDVAETLSWYEHEILSDVFDADTTMTDEKLRKITLWWLIFHAFRIDDLRHIEDDPLPAMTATLSETKIEDSLISFVTGLHADEAYSTGYSDFELFDVIVNNYDRLLEIAKSFAGISLDKIVEEYVGAGYLLFNELELSYRVKEAVLKIPETNCLFACTHMG